MDFRQTEQFKQLKQRNKYIMKNRKKNFDDCLSDYDGVFTGHEHVLISILELSEIGPYFKKENAPECLTLDIFGTKYCFYDVEFFEADEFKKNNMSNIPMRRLLNSIKPEDKIINYSLQYNPTWGLGFYVLVRKIKGRYEVIEKFRWYVS